MLARFLLSDDEDGLVERLLRALKPFELCRRQYFLWVLQPARSPYDVIRGNRNANLVVAKGQCELSPSEELLVLPTFIVVKHTHTGKPLGKSVYVITVV